MISRFSRLAAYLVLLGALSVALWPGTSRSEGRAVLQSTSGPLDTFPDVQVAYGTHRLRSDYGGAALRVRRARDGAEQDVGFTDGGALDVATLESWLSGSDGYVVRWYSQVGGAPDLVQSTPERQPRIATAGAVTRDADGRAAIKFDAGRTTYLDTETALPARNDLATTMTMLVTDLGGTSTDQHILNFADGGQWSHYSLSIRVQDGSLLLASPLYDGNIYGGFGWGPSAWIVNGTGSTVQTFDNHEQTNSTTITGSASHQHLRVGASTKNHDRGYDGHVAALALFPGQSAEAGVLARYDALNAAFNLGPTDYNPDALLPQRAEWQVAMYNWLETIDTTDVALSRQSMTWDAIYNDIDAVADLWMQVEALTASRVVRAEPEWYTLDAGNGKGIEATGAVRVWHQPESGPGNPPRSWSNEPAFLYQLSIPNGDGSEGNPYYQDPALGRRALVVMMVDMMMYAAASDGYAQWGDMYGKALLGWAETYRWCGSLLDAQTRAAVENGFDVFLNRMINGEYSPRAVNTNMDMFAIHGVADLYMATDDAALKSKAVQAAKKWLLGYTDGQLGSKHDVFAAAGYDGGVFDPSGFIMEGDQPDVFYGGESIYHIAGAVAALIDRDTGAVPADWQWLEEVLRRLQEWRTYQYFYDPGVASASTGGVKAGNYITAGAGMSGRTGAGVPSGQADEVWKFATMADRFPEARHVMRRGGHTRASRLPSIWAMEDDILERLSSVSSALGSTYTGTPPEWTGWSPWTKPTAYLPQKGWYSRLQPLLDGDDPSTYAPVEQSGTTYNKAFGGHPVGDQYWAYKDTDGSREWGFFVEAQARQGGYGGWYGGKIETFWTESTGVVLISRHGKTGCDPNDREDSTCFSNLDEKAAHHVWGRDENGNGFTTLLLRGRELQRSSTFNLGGTPPTVVVENIFNDPSLSATTSKSGEQTGSEIEGAFAVTNTFAAQADGLRVTHALTSDGTDSVSELWATLPVYLRAYAPNQVGDQMQADLADTTIEYWDGTSWQALPEDTTGDGVPERVSTTALRLGRDFLLGDGPQYAYIAMDGTQDVRLSTGPYYDPYQTMTGVRAVHIDLHGNPGTAQPLPTAKSVTYTIQTTDPTTDENIGHAIDLTPGWNLVATSVQPDNPALDAVVAPIASQVQVVRDASGQLYVPSEEFNEIGTWDTQQAYAIFAEAATTLWVHGTPIDATVALSLESGWNMVPYFLTEALPVEEALDAIRDQLVLVKDEQGRIYYPQSDVNDLVELQPGHGYQIYVSEASTLTYPVP